MDDELPSKDAVFELEQIGAYYDGDWPGWPQQEMLDWMPTRVRTLGTVEQSMHNGPCLSIPQQRLHQVIEGLAMAGFNVRRDDNLVSAASLCTAGALATRARRGAGGTLNQELANKAYTMMQEEPDRVFAANVKPGRYPGSFELIDIE